MPADKWDKFVVPDSGGDKWDKFVVNDQPAQSAPAIPKVPASIGAALDRGQASNESKFNLLDRVKMAAQEYTQQAAGIQIGAIKRPFQVVGGMAKNAYDANSRLASGNGSVGDVLTANPATTIPSQLIGGTYDATIGALAGTEGGKKAIASSYVGQGLDNLKDPYKVGENTGAGLFDAATFALGDKVPTILKQIAGKVRGSGAPISIPEAADIHGAALRNAGGAPAKADIGATTSTTAPAMLEAADQLGVNSKNVTPSKWSAVSERAIQNQGDAFNGLIKQADPTTPIAVETKAAADAMRQEALSERNPNVAAKLNEVADRIEKETTLGGADQLRRSLNKETIAHHRKVNVSDANADLVNEANLQAVGKMRDIVYDKTGQQLGIPPDAIQQMKIRESALIRQNDWVQNSRKLIENDRLIEKNTGPINSARYQNQLPNASKAGVVSTVGKSVLGGRDAAFRSQLSKFLDAPRVPVRYPAANPTVANQSRLAGIVRRAGLNQSSTDVPAGAARTPLDEFLRHNPPAYQQPDMGQAWPAWADDPAYPVQGGSQTVSPAQAPANMEDISPANWPMSPKYPPARPWFQSDQWTRPAGRSTDVSAAELSDWIRRNGKRR